jgi:hypothetical protein
MNTIPAKCVVVPNFFPLDVNQSLCGDSSQAFYQQKFLWTEKLRAYELYFAVNKNLNKKSSILGYSLYNLGKLSDYLYV